MKKIKEKVIEIINSANVQINKINKSIETVKETPMYSNDHKLQVESEKKQEIISIRNKVAEDIVKLFDEEIQKLNSVNPYADSKAEETTNILKMIELTKDTMIDKEIKYLAEIYSDNSIVKRVLAAIADSRGFIIEGIQLIPHTVELESIKQQLIGIILSSGTGEISSIKLELLLRSMN